MGQHTEISWCDSTFNGWLGCTKVSPGCANCYAEMLMDTRYGKVKWGKGNPRVRTSAANWKLPLKWNKEAAIFSHTNVIPPKVFCASLSDWLDDEVPIEWLADLLKLIHDTPNLDWLLLSKRPENWRERIERVLILANGGDPNDQDWFARHGDTFPNCEFADWLNEWTGENPPANILIGASVENQPMLDKRIPELMKIPAKVRFLSVEPLLEEIKLPFPSGASITNQKFPDGFEHWSDNQREQWFLGTARGTYIARCSIGIDWVIVGGESGQKKRPFDCDWARSLRDQCKAAGVGFFMKQVDKVRAIPDDLMIREFPK